MNNLGTLIFFCGKMAAGKSTLAAKMARERRAILISEDEWLSALYPGEINNFSDYIAYSSRVKPVLQAHVGQLLVAGLSVVMDFPGNTPKQRAWFREIYSAHGAPHELHYVLVDDETCLKQLKLRRNERPERARFDKEEVIERVTSYFEPPTASEGFAVQVTNRVAHQQAVD